MKFKNIFIFIISIFTISNLTAQNNSPFVRFPALNSNGTQAAFSYQGDIWTVPVTGGAAHRITIHQAYEAYPQWSPNDKQIAFSSNRWGNDDIFVINADGRNIKRITYNSSADVLNDWTNNNKLIFTTRRTFRQIEWEREIYAASSKGGTPERILNAFGDMPVLSPDGKYLVFVKGPCRISREDYRGSANRDIWLYDFKNDKFTQLTTYEGNDFYPRWSDNNHLYFISSRKGKYNIFKMSLSAALVKNKIEQITNFQSNGITYLNISRNGKKLAFSSGTDIFIMNTSDNNPQKLNIQLGNDYRFDPIVHKNYSSKSEEFAVSPNGKLMAYTVHGEIFVKENKKDKKRSVNLSDNPNRDQHPQWISDSTLIFISDRAGQKDIYLVKSSDEKNSNIFKSLKHKIIRLTNTKTDEDWPVVSPDLKKVAYEIGRGKLVVRNIESNGTLGKSIIMLDGWAIPNNVGWSPDSRWLAYSLNNLDFNEEVFIQPVSGNKKPVNVSMHPKTDSHPVWSADGTKLAFVSNRNNNNQDVWFVWLNKKDWEKTKRDWEEESDSPKPSKEKKGKKDKKTKSVVKPVKIDVDNIYNRLVQVTSSPEDEINPAFSKDGKTVYFTTSQPAGKGRDLYSVKWDGTKIKRITKTGLSPSRLVFNRTDKYFYMTTRGGKIARLKDGGNKLESLLFTAKMSINFNAEKNQIFDEAWRVLNEGFYDPDFHGKNWLALKEKYKQMVIRASTKRDFRYMFNEMLGQLNASHMGLYGKDRADIQKEKTGLLGIEIKPVDDGIIVTHVIPRSPADRDFSKLNAGDKILSVNSTAVNINHNLYKELTNTANDKVLLRVEDKNGDKRDVIIRPAAGLSSLLYDEWVKDKRALVKKYSKGKLGYLHIKAMGWRSFERFERELTAAGNGKEGIIIDVRYNGGGWTTDYLMTVLTVRQHAYTIPRGATNNLQKYHKKFRNYYPYGERLPYSAWTKPSIAICNESSYSNAEIFSHAYKTLGIGKLVGVPTFGAVISTGGQTLIDGSFIRLPFRGWYVKATDKNMELGPAVPNFIVHNSPDNRAKGKDEQLKKAVDELMLQISSR